MHRRLAGLGPQIHGCSQKTAIRRRPVGGRTDVPGACEPEELLQAGMNLSSVRNGRQALNDVLCRRRAGQRRTQIRDQEALLDQLGDEPFDPLRINGWGLRGYCRDEILERNGLARQSQRHARGARCAHRHARRSDAIACGRRPFGQENSAPADERRRVGSNGKTTPNVQAFLELRDEPDKPGHVGPRPGYGRRLGLRQSCRVTPTSERNPREKAVGRWAGGHANVVTEVRRRGAFGPERLRQRQTSHRHGGVFPFLAGRRPGRIPISFDGQERHTHQNCLQRLVERLIFAFRRASGAGGLRASRLSTLRPHSGLPDQHQLIDREVITAAARWVGPAKAD